MTEVREGQTWKQERTPREGDDALWVVKDTFGYGSCYVNLRCVGTIETKEILKDSLRQDYTLYDELGNIETVKWFCDSKNCLDYIEAEVDTESLYLVQHRALVAAALKEDWTSLEESGCQYLYCPDCSEERSSAKESKEESPTTEDKVDEHADYIPHSNIYPRLFSGEPYIINPTYLIVHEDEFYGFDEWEPGIVIDGLADRKRVGEKGAWYDEHFNDTVEVYGVAREELLIRRCLGSCFPIMSPPTIDEAMAMARDRKKVVNREGRVGSIIGVHGKSEDRHILFFVRFDEEEYADPEFDSEIKTVWYHQLVERRVE